VSDPKFEGKPLLRKLLASAIADLIKTARNDGLRRDEVYWAITSASSDVYFPDDPPLPFNPSSFPHGDYPW